MKCVSPNLFLSGQSSEMAKKCSGVISIHLAVTSKLSYNIFVRYYNAKVIMQGLINKIICQDEILFLYFFNFQAYLANKGHFR